MSEAIKPGDTVRIVRVPYGSSPALLTHPSGSRCVVPGDEVVVDEIFFPGIDDQFFSWKYESGHQIQFPVFTPNGLEGRTNVGFLSLNCVERVKPVGDDECRCQSLMIGHDPDCRYILRRKGGSR